MRRASLMTGLLALGIAWLGLPQLGLAFSVHMAMHMIVVAVAAPLIALGVSGRPYDPVCKIPWLFLPIPVSVIELVVVWAWHTPMLHHAARHGTAALLAEQAMFLSSGLALWLAAFGGDARDGSNRRAAGVVALLLTSMHMTLLGALLGLAPRLLFAHASGFHGLSALEDQQLGGAIMLLVGGTSYLLGGLWLTIGLLKRPILSPEGSA